ncbi:FAD-binding protein, partial [Salmonella enterica subsp. enterica serovar Anatum]|nr:FAD-binding protein [Salmonella enterica subsp. enterica serovar Anatum]
ALYHPQARNFLLTEALRGEGAYLKRPDGSRFMPDVDERGELAQSITPLVRQFSAWLRENPALVQGVAKVVGVIWLFKGAL